MTPPARLKVDCCWHQQPWGNYWQSGVIRTSHYSPNCTFWMYLFIQFLYGSEIWTIKKNDLKKLVAFEMRCYREVLNITWKDKIRNEDVLLRISCCKFKPKRILARITESQLSWFGHVCKMSKMRLPKRILMEMVPGTNRQGRPRKRWENDIIAGSTFLEAYRNDEDRNRWADFVHRANVLWDTVQR